jgi:hypothetical protein
MPGVQIMGALLTAGKETYTDSYSPSGLMSVISGTLEPQGIQQYSWWRLAGRYAGEWHTDGRVHSNEEQLKAFIDHMETALVALMGERTWRYGYDSGSPLTGAEKEQYAQRMKELLSFLRFAEHQRHELYWSV